jgi:predicted nucleic acid-binding protein
VSGFLLDTNIPSESWRAQPAASVAVWLKSQVKAVQFISVVTVGELRKGAILLPLGAKRTRIERSIEVLIPARFGDRILPVTQAIAERWGALDAQRQQIGRPLSVVDGMIAATAIEYGLTVVTRNVRDFANLGVGIFNPEGWLISRFFAMNRI